jgi:hypothetical protein
LNNFVAFCFKRAKSNWLFLLDGADGTVLNLQRLVMSTETDSFDIFYRSFLLQNINPSAGGETAIANYRIFVGWRDATLTAGKRFQIRSRSTTEELLVTDQAATPYYTWGVRTMVYQNGKLWFAGAREQATAGYRPLIGRADATTLVVEDANYLAAPDGAGWDYTKIDILHTSSNAADHMIVGVGLPGDGSFNFLNTNKIMMVIGVDDSAATQWDSIGCWKWTTYMITEASTYWRRIDDLVGPIDDGAGTQTIYFWMRQWSDAADFNS